MKTLSDPDLTLEDAELLVKNGADIHKTDDLGQNLLCYTTDITLFKFFIENGIDINHIDVHGRTILHQTNSVELIKILVNAGANVNIQDNNGFIPLIYFHKLKDDRITEVLVGAGSNLNLLYELYIFDRYKYLFKNDTFYHYLNRTVGYDKYHEYIFTTNMSLLNGLDPYFKYSMSKYEASITLPLLTNAQATLTFDILDYIIDDAFIDLKENFFISIIYDRCHIPLLNLIDNVENNKTLLSPILHITYIKKLHSILLKLMASKYKDMENINMIMTDIGKYVSVLKDNDLISKSIHNVDNIMSDLMDHGCLFMQAELYKKFETILPEKLSKKYTIACSLSKNDDELIQLLNKLNDDGSMSCLTLDADMV